MNRIICIVDFVIDTNIEKKTFLDIARKVSNEKY